MNELLALERRPKELLRPCRRTAKLIAIEEHCATPIPVPTISSTFNQFLSEYMSGLRQRLGDVAYRIEVMDRNGIAAQIISLNQPGAQGFTNLEQCVEYCQKVNRFIHEEYVAKYPGRFFAFAVLPTQEGSAAAAELERCVREYGAVGAMINGFTNAPGNTTGGLYLDDPQFNALWEVAERLEKPIFLHPRIPLAQNIQVLHDIPIFHGAPYGFGRETVEHCLRLMYAGVLDRFPGLKIALGHMGEGLSWILPRTDSTFRLYTAGQCILHMKIVIFLI
jgi:predicted TIM-barrel fold metal-dependent hydrolase